MDIFAQEWKSRLADSTRAVFLPERSQWLQVQRITRRCEH